MSMMYYDQTGVYDVVNGAMVINDNGKKVQAAYATF